MWERSGKGKTSMPENDKPLMPEQPVRRPASAALMPAQPAASRSASAAAVENADGSQPITNISAGMTIVGKIAGKGAVKVFGRIEGELRASNITIAEGAQVEGEIFADDLTVGGQVKGNVHANRVRLNSTSIVEGDIFHRSLAIEENAKFEGSSKREANGVDLSARTSSPAAISGDRRANGGVDRDADSYVTQRFGTVSSVSDSDGEVSSH
jgi:cytoskeletal protein CcmA (bactofilin family)